MEIAMQKLIQYQNEIKEGLIDVIDKLAKKFQKLMSVARSPTFKRKR